MAALLALGLTTARAAQPAAAQDGVSAWIDSLGAATQAGPAEGWAAQSEAEAAVARKIRARIESTPGAPELSQPDAAGQTPLIRAALRGYAEVVDALLADPGVRADIDAADRDGLTAWMAAQFARPLTLASCHPQVLVREAVGLWGPNLRRQGYFAQQARMPFERIRLALGAAGAKPDLDAAKRHWLMQCPGHDPALDPAIAASEDLMGTLLADSNPRLRAFFAEIQSAPDSRLPVPMSATDPRTGEGMPAQPQIRDPARSHPKASLDGRGMHCTRMPKPKLGSGGPFDWGGRLLFKLVVEIQDSVPVAATTTVVSGTRIPMNVAMYFRAAVYQALGTYRCAGDHVFHQEFEFEFR